MLVKKIFVFALVAFPFLLSAQSSTRKQRKAERDERVRELIAKEQEGVIAYSRQTVFGLKATTDGYGALLEIARMKTVGKANLFSLEIGEHKHAKEERLTPVDGFTGFQVGNSYIYGKQNNFYFAKLGYAQQRLLGGKGLKNGVAVSAIYGGGFSAGLLKPYYLRVITGTGEEEEIKYPSPGDSLFLDPSAISGGAGFGKGFGDLKFVPGLHAKAAVRFDYGRYNETVSALEVGVQAEYYTQKMPIMILNKEKRFFFNAYVALLLGKRR